MKKINNIYLATEKDGSIEKNMVELPENPGGYSAIFASFPPDFEGKKFLEKALKTLSETEEDVHPAMFIPLSFFLPQIALCGGAGASRERKGKKAL